MGIVALTTVSTGARPLVKLTAPPTSSIACSGRMMYAPARGLGLSKPSISAFIASSSLVASTGGGGGFGLAGGGRGRAFALGSSLEKGSRSISALMMDAGGGGR